MKIIVKQFVTPSAALEGIERVFNNQADSQGLSLLICDMDVTMPESFGVIKAIRELYDEKNEIAEE